MRTSKVTHPDLGGLVILIWVDVDGIRLIFFPLSLGNIEFNNRSSFIVDFGSSEDSIEL